MSECWRRADELPEPWWADPACTPAQWSPRGDHDSRACYAIACNVIACWPTDPWQRADGGYCAPLPPLGSLRAFSDGFSNGYS